MPKSPHNKQTVMDLLRPIIHPDDGKDYISRHSDLLYNKYLLVSEVNPASICEIGVRTGYAMLMFMLAVDHNNLLGIDNASSTHGGFPGAVFHAVQKLDMGRWSLWIKDSQVIEEFPFGDFEFWHIDGDHSAAGTINDLNIAYENGARWMLVDDYGRIPETRDGADSFLANKDGLELTHIDEFQSLITRSQ